MQAVVGLFENSLQSKGKRYTENKTDARLISYIQLQILKENNSKKQEFNQVASSKF